IVSAEQNDVVGMICAFDVQPLTLTDRQIEGLKELGRLGAGTRRAMLLPTSTPRAGMPDHLPARSEAREAPVPPTVLNRDAGSEAAARELARVRDAPNRLSVVLLDVNDTASGTLVPVESGVDRVGDTLTRTIRATDLAIRWSRHEMLVVLPGAGQ